MTRTLTTLFCAFALTATAIPAYANEDFSVANEGYSEDLDAALTFNTEANDPTARPRRPRHPRGAFSCFARNAWGHTFRASARGGMDRRWVQWQAVESCRRNSPPFLERSCRPLGCRGGW